MFGTIRKHQTWLWAVIITITVISFVVFFNPTAKYSGRSGGTANLGSIDGQPVTTDAYRAAATEANFNYFFSHGDWPDHDPNARQSGFNIEREVYQRLFLLKRAHDLNIQVGKDAVGKMAANVLASLGRNGTPVPVDIFEKQILTPKGLTLADFQLFLKNDVTIHELIVTVGQNGRLTTPQEAELLYRREREELATEAVFFPATNYLGQITVAPAALGQFFTNQMARYRLPDRRVVSYIKWKAEDFTAAADKQIATITNLDMQLETMYYQRGSNYYGGKKFADAKAGIQADVRRELALRAARNQAAAFADQLLAQSSAPATFLDQLAAHSNLAVNVSSPFSADKMPVELVVPAAFTRAAFALTGDEPFGGPVVAEDAIYVMALKKLVPSEIPAFDTIRDQVTADFKLMSAYQLAVAAGTNFANAAAKNFSAACADSKFTPVKLPAFSLSTRALPEVEQHIAFGRLQEIAYGMAAGATSGFIGGNDGGLVLHLIARNPASEEKLRADLPAFLGQIRNTRQNEAFQSWFMREAQTALRDTPLARSAK